MSDALIPDDDQIDAEIDEYAADDEYSEEEYEEISSEEVDRVVAMLEDLLATVESENVRMHLEEALNNVYYLVYEDEEDEALGEAA